MLPIVTAANVSDEHLDPAALQLSSHVLLAVQEVVEDADAATRRHELVTKRRAKITRASSYEDSFHVPDPSPMQSNGC
jgi:hypothetical protein